MTTIAWGQMNSPVGWLTLALNQHGLCRLEFSKQTDFHLWFQRWFPDVTLERNDQALLPYVQQLEEYFSSQRRQFDLPLDLHGTDFQKSVWHHMQTIPYGETWSYKELATAIGNPKAVRAVGGANNKNPVAIIVPCHRVIGANGSMVGFGGGLPVKEKLLQLEGYLSNNLLA